jgi:hypothetical protein
MESFYLLFAALAVITVTRQRESRHKRTLAGDQTLVSAFGNTKYTSAQKKGSARGRTTIYKNEC